MTGRWDRDYATYPFQSVDGLVTEFGGAELKLALEAHHADPVSGVRCPVGSAKVTRRCGELAELFDAVIHAVPPMYRLMPDARSWVEQTTSTYHAAFDVAQREGLATLAVPLLGMGARGADVPKPTALKVAAHAALSWRGGRSGRSGHGGHGGHGRRLTARFGVQDSTTAHALSEAIEDAIGVMEGISVEPIAPPPKAEERWAVVEAAGY